MRRMPVQALPEPGERVQLDAAASHHALHVLRLPRGAELLVFDGQGRQAPARLVEVQSGQAVLEGLGPPQHAAPAHPLHLILGATKGPALDLAVRMGTEAGATDIHPVLTARSVARGERIDRWQRIAQSAAQQCGRADVPRIHPVLPLCPAVDALLDQVPGIELRVAQPGGAALGPARGPAAVCVGPEGGFTDAEIQQLLDRGALPLGLSAWILRADTAAAVATALTAPR